MKDEKKTDVNDKEAVEIDLDELEQVTGGSIKDVKHTKTTDVSSNTKGKI
ncbi:MAG: hypothetical protein J1F64_05640 [Oscillospiraceae bacterium]|nr:hypothetical protein [Oscillospiraceae bacterium]